MLLLVWYVSAGAQTITPVDQLPGIPDQFFSKINSKVQKLNEQLSAKTEKYLQRLLRKEEKIQRRLSRIDSTKAKQLFPGAQNEYSKLTNKIKNPSLNSKRLGGEYVPYLDSLKGSLSFLEKNNELLGGTKNLTEKAKNALAGVSQLESRLQQADEIKQFIRQRKQQIKEVLSQYTKLPSNLSKQLQNFNKEVYYYSEQVRSYREMLNDPDKLTQKVLSLLNKLPAFQDFMKEHSMLAGLFGLPAGYSNVASLNGLQTRAQVQALIQGQLSSAGSGGQQVLQQNLQAAQAQLNQFKDKLKVLGKGSDDMDMPDFKPNNQRTKSFLQRLEIGTNLQSVKSSTFLPTTTDLGLSIGYKLSNYSTIGIGGSYKVGWGKDIRNIVLTSEGVGLRSFLDIKLRGSFFLTSGYEYNYQPAIAAFANGGQREIAWTESGLVGISKIVSLKTKFFKKTKLQLLWDILSYRQMPRTQAIKFRVGYSF